MGNKKSTSVDITYSSGGSSSSCSGITMYQKKQLLPTAMLNTTDCKGNPGICTNYDAHLATLGCFSCMKLSCAFL